MGPPRVAIVSHAQEATLLELAKLEIARRSGMGSVGLVGREGCGHLLHHFQMLLATGFAGLEINTFGDRCRLEVSARVGFGRGHEEVDWIGWGNASA